MAVHEALLVDCDIEVKASRFFVEDEMHSQSTS